LEKYKIYLGVKDVKVVVRPYKTRTAFTNLASSSPTICLNKHLIDDEEVVEYLILRELIHIALHRYRSRYTGGLSYAVTAFSTSLYQRRRLRRLGRRWKKADRDEQELQRSLFLWRSPRPGRRTPRRGAAAVSVVDKRKRKKRLSVLFFCILFLICTEPMSAGSDLQV
jgi:hypothetical protein